MPDMSDENFAANASGVAMKYKVLAFEQMTAIKERYFKKGLKRRLQLLFNILGIKQGKEIDPANVDIIFTRNLPVNEMETAQMVSTLSDMVSRRTLLSQISFVEDADEELKRLQEEKNEEMERQKAIFGDPGPLASQGDGEDDLSAAPPAGRAGRRQTGDGEQ
jgi:SPP1 family phage portal protein